MAEPTRTQDDTFLPDFCSLPVLFAVILLAELFAVVMAMAAASQTLIGFWERLGLTSVFVQLNTLSASLALCRLRPLLGRASAYVAGATSYLVILLLLLLLSALSLAFYRYLGLRPAVGTDAQFYIYNLCIGAIVAAIALRYFYMQDQWKRRIQAEHDARLQALQARIRPHFLFNSMNTIASLIRSRPEQAEEAVEDLADLFRASLSQTRQLVSLADELTLARGYARIEELRLGERLRITWAVDELPMDAMLPPLTLQPLLENAIYHGIEPLAGGGEVSISGAVRGRRLALRLENPLPPPAERPSRGNQMAQENVRERLRAHFGEGAGLLAESRGDSYVVELSIPLDKNREGR